MKSKQKKAAICPKCKKPFVLKGTTNQCDETRATTIKNKQEKQLINSEKNDSLNSGCKTVLGNSKTVASDDCTDEKQIIVFKNESSHYSETLDIKEDKNRIDEREMSESDSKNDDFSARYFKEMASNSSSETNNKKNGSLWKICIVASVLVIFFIVCSSFKPDKLKEQQSQPQKTETTYRAIIEDNANLLSKEQKATLQETLDQFLETTGVPVSFYTDYNSTWRSNYTNLIDYSYDLYVDTFEDEDHWVIVYTTSQEGDSDHPSWYWEGMQGNNTDEVLDVFLKSFNEQVQVGLKHGESTFDVFNDAFTMAIDEFNN